jgi:enoyl-[acyl-carrier-protein] reductase (NADH)
VRRPHSAQALATASDWRWVLIAPLLRPVVPDVNMMSLMCPGCTIAALDVAKHGIRVNAVAPSLATHPFLAKVTSEELLAELAIREAFGRAVHPWEVANVMVFPASDYASYLTGEVVSVSSQHP